MFYVFSSSRTLVATRPHIEQAMRVLNTLDVGSRVENVDGIVMAEKVAAGGGKSAERRLRVENDFRAVQNGMRREAVAA